MCGLLRSRPSDSDNDSDSDSDNDNDSESESGLFTYPLLWSLLMATVCIAPYILSSLLPHCDHSCHYHHSDSDSDR